MDNLNNVKKALDSFVDSQKKKMMNDVQPSLNNVANAVSREMGKIIPLLQEVVNAVKENTATINSLELKVPDVHVEAPIVNIPETKIPKPEVNVNVPETKFPKFEFPKFPDFPKQKEYSWKDPLPVILTDVEGRPYTSGYFGGSGGGTKAISDLQQLAGYPISVGSGLTDSGTLRVTIPTDASVSVSVSGSTGSLATALIDSSGVQYSGSNPIPTTATLSSATGQGDGSAALRTIQAGDTVSSMSIVSNIAALDVKQLSGDISSVSIVSNIATLDVKQMSGDMSSMNLVQIGGNAVVVGSGFQDNALRVVNATDAVTSVSIAGNVATLDVKQMSGDMSSMNLVQTAGAATVVGTGYQDNALRVVNATDAITSVNVVSSITLTSTISGSLTSAVVTGPSAIGVADDGTAPVQAGIIARTTNPTKVTDGQVVKIMGDAVGRQLNRPVQVRGLLTTAYLAFTSGSGFGTETALKAAPASTFLDLIYITASNTSDAALSVDIRSETGAGIVANLQVPASGTTGVAYPVPLPQNTAAATWTVDPPDITGTTLTISALFSQEV